MLSFLGTYLECLWLLSRKKAKGMIHFFIGCHVIGQSQSLDHQICSLQWDWSLEKDEWLDIQGLFCAEPKGSAGYLAESFQMETIRANHNRVAEGNMMASGRSCPDRSHTQTLGPSQGIPSVLNPLPQANLMGKSTYSIPITPWILYSPLLR